MSFRWREVVRSGNSTAIVKNFYPETGLLVLMNIQGNFESGMTIIGDSSGTSLTLSNFIINDDYDLNYDYDGWSDILEIQVVCDDGSFVVMYASEDETDMDNLVTI
jgi:hypothetical protein